MSTPVRVGIMTEGTAVGSFIPTLKDLFGGVACISAADLAKPQVLKCFDLVVLPGIATEFSHYPDILTAEAQASVMDAVRHGLRLWTDCAASYVFSKSYSYRSPTRAVEWRSGVGLFEGHAWGPVDCNHTLMPDRPRFSDTRVVRVAFEAASVREEALMLYHNGPAYMPRRGEEIDVLACYTTTDGQKQIAAAAKSFDNGRVLFSGILPEMAPVDITPSADLAGFGHLANLRAACLPHEAARKRLLVNYLRALHL